MNEKKINEVSIAVYNLLYYAFMHRLLGTQIGQKNNSSTHNMSFMKRVKYIKYAQYIQSH